MTLIFHKEVYRRIWVVVGC